MNRVHLGLRFDAKCQVRQRRVRRDDDDDGCRERRRLDDERLRLAGHGWAGSVGDLVASATAKKAHRFRISQRDMHSRMLLRFFWRVHVGQENVHGLVRLHADPNLPFSRASRNDFVVRASRRELRVCGAIAKWHHGKAPFLLAAQGRAGASTHATRPPTHACMALRCAADEERHASTATRLADGVAVFGVRAWRGKVPDLSRWQSMTT